MGNIFLSKSNEKNHLIIHRVLSIDPINVTYGICAAPMGNLNPMKNQCIQINGGKPHQLLVFTETPESLAYEFEDNIFLSLWKIKNKIYWSIKFNSIDKTLELDPIYYNLIKKISWDSEQLDKIVDFINNSLVYGPVAG